MGADFVTIDIVARPGSQRRGVLRVDARGLTLGVASPAEKGKANGELIAAIANVAEVPHGQVSIVRGASSRNKVVRIACAEPAIVAQRISLATAEAKQR
jgi:uncharacterized protein (TIGR00251 family)